MILAVGSTRLEAVTQLLTLIIIFALVLALTYFVTRFAGNYQKRKYAGRNITIIETMRISGTKYIQIVKTGSQYFAIAVCKDTVTLIGELDGETLILPEDADSAPPESFSAVLDRFKKDKPED